VSLVFVVELMLSIKMQQAVVLCRSQRTLENRLALDDDKITLLEQQVRSLKISLGDAEHRYEEVTTHLFSNTCA